MMRFTILRITKPTIDIEAIKPMTAKKTAHPQLEVSERKRAKNVAMLAKEAIKIAYM